MKEINEAPQKSMEKIEKFDNAEHAYTYAVKIDSYYRIVNNGLSIPVFRTEEEARRDADTFSNSKGGNLESVIIDIKPLIDSGFIARGSVFGFRE